MPDFRATDPDRLRLSLPDGTPVLFRPVRPDDAPLLTDGLKRLSTESRITRFFSPVSHLSDQQLHYLTDVDQHTHVAWGALDLSGPEPVGLGIARFARLPSEPRVAEVAVTVVDAAQRLGVGSRLLAILFLLARRRGIDTFRAILMAQNRPLVRRIQHLGGVTRREEGEVTVNLPLVSRPHDLPDTPEAAAFGRVLGEVRAAFEAQAAGRAGYSQNDA